MRDLTQSLQSLYDVVDCLVDDQVGIINHVTEVPPDSGSPAFFHFYAKACNTRAFSAQKNFPDAGGASSHRGLAMAKAIGEAVERYCASIYDRHSLPLTSFEGAPFPCVSPASFALFSPQQYKNAGFPYRPFSANTPIRWTPAIDLLTKESLHVPASMVFLPYPTHDERQEAAITQSISTGLACHGSYADAAISAICEVIERDAFMIMWQARLSMPHIRLDSLSIENRDLVGRFERAGGQVSILNLTLDHGVPTILSVWRGPESDAPALVFAASAHIDPEQAARKSLEELAHSRRMAQHLVATSPAEARTPDFLNIEKQNQHVRLFCDHASRPLADFVFASKSYCSFEDLPNLCSGEPNADLRTLASALDSIGHKALIADVTTPDIECLGLCVVRAIVPGFHPLFMGHRLRALGGKRLWEIPQQLGFSGITQDSGDNPIPHPYP